MSEKPTQANQPCKLVTPFEADKLVITRFEGTEGLSELFEWRVEALAVESSIRFRDHIGEFFSFHLKTRDGVGRDFGGVLAEARSTGLRGDYWAYQLILRPWPWMLSLQAQSRIFENMRPNDIILKVLGGFRFSRIENRMGGEHPTLEYTVQYRETDLNFALRLMEKYGIYYYFKFEPAQGDKPGAHILVLADLSQHETLDAPKSIRVFADFTQNLDLQKLHYWGETESAITEVFVLEDYNYRTSNADISGDDVNGDYQTSFPAMIHDHPGGYRTKGEGNALAEVLMEAEGGRALRAFASGYAPSLLPGRTLPVTSDFVSGTPYQALILRCNHTYGDQNYQSADSAPASYAGSYEFAPAEQKYRMPMRTRRPVIVGTQSAKVVGAENQEIDLDSQGRILCEFYWTRNEYDEKGKKLPKKHTLRVRVAQFWAGSKRGALFIPRIGDEVLVQFEEGDPDRPIVVGSVYNDVNAINKTLPQDKNQSGILTRSTMRSEGYNMLLFDDTAGAEKVKLRAEKDLMFKAKNNEQRDIGANQTENIGGNETINVGGPPKPGQAGGGGNFTLNAFQTATINIGPNGSPLTQVIMDNSSITLNVGPQGQAAQIVMNMTGITLSVGPGGSLAAISMGPGGIAMQATPMTMVSLSPAGIAEAATTVSTLATAAVTVGAPAVTIGAAVTMPLVTIGAGTCGGLPII